jgi:hypothetical protein
MPLSENEKKEVLTTLTIELERLFRVVSNYLNSRSTACGPSK